MSFYKSAYTGNEIDTRLGRTDGLTELKNNVTALMNHRTICLSFTVADFVQNGQKWELRIPKTIHKRGNDAFVERVQQEMEDGTFADVIYQAYTSIDGTVVVEGDKYLNKGQIFIKGAF